MKILVPEIIAGVGRKYLIDRGYKIYDGTGRTKESMIRDISDCDGLIIRTNPCDKDVLGAALKLKVIAKHGVGVDNIDMRYCDSHNIQVTFTPLANGQSVAEHALYLMLACSRNANTIYKHFRENKDFETRERYYSVELCGKEVGIFGLGRIGRALAKMCNGIGMKVLGYDPYVMQRQLGANIKLFKDYHDVLRRADYISMHLPCNNETKGLITLREFDMMKKNAFFINTSRGGVVVEKDLIKALQNGVIKGAGIDVFEIEPIEVSNPLFSMENVIVTPHEAGGSEEAVKKTSLHAAMGIDEFFSGRPLSWPLNKLSV